MISTLSHRKRIFAAVAPPIPIGAGRKPIRRVLIFDNHPATLQLLRDFDLAQRGNTIWHILIGAGLGVVALVGMFLPLL